MAAAALAEIEASGGFGWWEVMVPELRLPPPSHPPESQPLLPPKTFPVVAPSQLIVDAGRSNRAGEVGCAEENIPNWEH